MWRHEKQNESKLSYEKKGNDNLYKVACLIEVSSKFIQEKEQYSYFCFIFVCVY